MSFRIPSVIYENGCSAWQGQASRELHQNPFLEMQVRPGDGATTWAMNDLIRRSAICKDGTYVYVGPTRETVIKEVWGAERGLFYWLPSPVVVPWKSDESSLTITFPSGSRLVCVGADNLGGMKGLVPDGVIADCCGVALPSLMRTFIPILHRSLRRFFVAIVLENDAAPTNPRRLSRMRFSGLRQLVGVCQDCGSTVSLRDAPEESADCEEFKPLVNPMDHCG